MLLSQSVSPSAYGLGIIDYKFLIKNSINSSLTLEISPLSAMAILILRILHHYNTYAGFDLYSSG